MQYRIVTRTTSSYAAFGESGDRITIVHVQPHDLHTYLTFREENYHEIIVSTTEIPSATACAVCGIETVPATRTRTGVRHAEPRTLENYLHNGTPDHNAKVKIA